jgi:hypothetical protein
MFSRGLRDAASFAVLSGFMVLESKHSRLAVGFSALALSIVVARMLYDVAWSIRVGRARGPARRLAMERGCRALGALAACLGGFAVAACWREQFTSAALVASYVVGGVLGGWWIAGRNQGKGKQGSA